MPCIWLKTQEKASRSRLIVENSDFMHKLSVIVMLDNGTRCDVEIRYSGLDLVCFGPAECVEVVEVSGKDARYSVN